MNGRLCALGVSAVRFCSEIKFIQHRSHYDRC